MPVAADIVASRGVEGDNEEGIGFGARLAVKEERSTPLIKEEEKGGGWFIHKALSKYIFV